MNVEDKVFKIVANAADNTLNSDISISDNIFKDLCLDSIDIACIECKLEDEFNFPIYDFESAKLWDENTTISKIIDFVNTKLRGDYYFI